MLSWNKNDDIKIIINALRQDKIMLASSDTVLGLFGQLTEKSKKKLDSIKIRDLKPYIVLVGSYDQVYALTDQAYSPELIKIMNSYWPGPLTIIFKAKKTLPLWMIGIDETIAIRMPYHLGLQQLLASVDGIFTTSANISGQPLPDAFSQVDPIITQQVDLICSNGLDLQHGLASTILNVSSGSINIIRQGSVVVGNSK